ncbi:MAG TPA: asparagine synthase (glutamine-hydrolyzing) [Gemmatimonadaceae bacterium]|nr:asparagine synthase (glutamine-hydrolyzing) [Gemmatimonadaceae bacterium]
MCGICGFTGSRSDAALGRMVAALHHRGPDDRGMAATDEVSLGMARLAVIDLSDAGHQPMGTPDGRLTIVYNGEVYNFADERRMLQQHGCEFHSGTDTEVVLRMYERYGDDFLLRLRGMFALAIWDGRRGNGRLLLARDHFGIKPLLYAESAGRLVFASELRSLVASGLIEPSVDPVALRMLLTYGSVIQPRTILSGVSALPPAHRLIVENGATRIERYWSLGRNRRPELRRASYAEQVDAVGAALEESARLQLVADVPLGAFLSGGVDSSVLVAIMTRALGHSVDTFSVGYGGEGDDIDESREAARMAALLGARHSNVVVTGADVRARIEHIAHALDQPSVDGVNSYFVSLAARRRVTVAISGTGGDELFAGYPWFIRMARADAASRAHPVRSTVRRLMAQAARARPLDRLVRPRGGGRLVSLRQGTFIETYARTYEVFGTARAARLLADEVAATADAGRAAHWDLSTLDELADGSAVERVSGLATRGYLTNQLLRDIDAVSMAHSLEVRVPYLDPVVADTALSLPDSAKLRDTASGSFTEQSTYRTSGAKRVLIDVGRRWLPADFDVQPKRGFAMPFERWLRGPLAEVLQDTLSPSSVRRRGLLHAPAVATVARDFERGATSWMEPWLLMMLELWCRAVLDVATSGGSRTVPEQGMGSRRHADGVDGARRTVGEPVP